jgi:predicted Zn-dependent peptidase
MKRRQFTAFLAFAAVTTFSFTQGPPQDSKAVSVSKIERKGKAPVSKDVLKVKLPRAVEYTLDNGLTVLIIEDHRFPTVSVNFQIYGAGGVLDPGGAPGLASVTAQMMREGTKTRSSKQVAEDIDKLGATFSVNSSFSATAVNLNGSVLTENLDAWFGLMADVLLNPSFPADELAKFKQRTKVNLKTQRSQSSFLSNERFSKAVYGSHPAGRVTFTNESVDSFTPEALAKWHDERYVPQNGILGIAGDVTPAELMPKVKTWLGQAVWKKTDLKVVDPENPSPAKISKIYLVDRPNSVQTTIAMGNIAIDRRSPDYVAMTVMNRIIGDGPAARLFTNLREEKGYTYGAYSRMTTQRYPGPWEAYSDVRTEVTDGAMTEFLREINRIRDEKVPAAELDEAKRAVVAGFALSLEQPSQLLQYAVTRKFYGFPADYWDTYPASISAVTADDVARVAQKYLNPAAMQIVAVGDGSKIKTVMEKYGSVEVYDTDGNKKQP